MKFNSAKLKQKLVIWPLFLIMFLASACGEVEIKNGEIPPEHLPKAEALMGTYEGHFDSHPMTIELKLNGNKVEVKTSSDLIADSCLSQVQELKTLKFQKQDGVVRLAGASFAFEPNQCRRDVLGRKLMLDFDLRDPVPQVFRAKIHIENRFEEKCHPWYDGRSNLDTRCEMENIPVYLTGKFYREK